MRGIIEEVYEEIEEITNHFNEVHDGTWELRRSCRRVEFESKDIVITVELSFNSTSLDYFLSNLENGYQDSGVEVVPGSEAYNDLMEVIDRLLSKYKADLSIRNSLIPLNHFPTNNWRTELCH